MKTCLRIILTWLLPVLLAQAQQGDKQGEQQVRRVAREKIPPAPPLSPAEAMKTFKLAPGFRLELVASEPLIECPIALSFDPDGRLWVLEMRGFMPDADGRGELEPLGRVSILEDTDHDGRMDKRTVFLDGLVQPRALALARDGALVAEPPNLWFCRDTNGDGRCDQKTLVTSDYAAQDDPKLGNKANPEHASNGLVRDLDNWIYNLDHTYRYRFADGRWRREETPNRSQWGLAQDDFGRLFFTSNSDPLRGDLIPLPYARKFSPGIRVPGLNVQVERDLSVWPIRVNPGVNRGYQEKQLRADGTLATFTAACGTTIYRGDAYPDEFRGNAFVCEPSGNVIRRERLFESDGIVTATNAYDKAEFLASTDERFRPVNLYTAPDGTLYVVDMYHGIIQHRIYMTSYLRQQVEERGLDRPQNQGRIYRIVHESKAPGPQPQLNKLAAAELVRTLAHPNGWWRDTAQRLLVERADLSVVPVLQTFAAAAHDPLARLHALWTLEGLERLNAPVIVKAFGDAHPKIRAAAVRLAEPMLRSINAGGDAGELRSKLLALAKDPAPDVQVQLALTLGEIAPDAASKEILTAMQRLSPSALARELAAFSVAARDPVKTNIVSTGLAPSLSPELQKVVAAGKAMYDATCVVCHQPHGLGMEGLAPPLVGSEWVSGSPQRLARIVLHGVRGPITVNKQVYQLDMPSLGILEDEQIAAVLTYIRHEWGHNYPAVETAMVKQIREAETKRADSWSEAELKKID